MIQSIRLQHFRSYTDDSFEFSPSVNIIVGPNASGKTNLLEAILFNFTGSSYRASDKQLIQFNRPWTRIESSVDDNPRVIKIVSQPQITKTFDINGRIMKRLLHDHKLPVVLFEPKDLEMLDGPPEMRRQFLDNLLSQINPGYSSTIRMFRRAVAQRNRLLKNQTTSPDQLFPWNVRISELGGSIFKNRGSLIDLINKNIDQLYNQLAHSQVQVLLKYLPSVGPEQYESRLFQRLEENTKSDILLGFTSFGPHREDFKILFNGKSAEEVASRGETRTIILALKFIELKILENKKDKTPLLLLDDVFSELDGTRRKLLTSHLQQYQTFITTTDADAVVEHFGATSTLISVDNN